MPVGDYTKDEIRKIAEEAGLPVAHKPDSQEICFVPDNDYAAFIDREAGDLVPAPGNFVDKDGNILGRHKGITHYTIGQRRGLEIAAGHRIFVTGIKPETNEVVIGENEDVFTDSVVCENVNYMAVEKLEDKRRVLAKIRYNHGGEYCNVSNLPDGRLLLTFEKPVRAATPGQAAVFYDGEYVLGGGTIL
jgi:tRNA-specific 2-thiouridylase